MLWLEYKTRSGESHFGLGGGGPSKKDYLSEASGLTLTVTLRGGYARRSTDSRNPDRARPVSEGQAAGGSFAEGPVGQGFNISVAEMDDAVTWQSATISVVAISHSRQYLHGLIEEVERAARRMINELGAELADSFWDYIES